jgi:hypothetical protein
VRQLKKWRDESRKGSGVRGRRQGGKTNESEYGGEEREEGDGKMEGRPWMQVDLKRTRWSKPEFPHG